MPSAEKKQNISQDKENFERNGKRAFNLRRVKQPKQSIDLIQVKRVEIDARF